MFLCPATIFMLPVTGLIGYENKQQFFPVLQGTEFYL